MATAARASTAATPLVKQCQPKLDRHHPHPKCRCSRWRFHLSILLSRTAGLSRVCRPLQWATWGQDAQPTPFLPSFRKPFMLPPSLSPSLTKNERKVEHMRPVNAANDGASFRPLAENTEAMRRWSSEGMLSARRSRPLARLCETRGPAKGRLKNGAAALMHEVNEIGSGSGASARQGRGKRTFSELQLTGLWLVRRENRRAVQRFARLCSF